MSLPFSRSLSRVISKQALLVSATCQHVPAVACQQHLQQRGVSTSVADGKESLWKALKSRDSTLTQADSYSKLLTSSQRVYELQFDYVKPDCMSEYLEFVRTVNTQLSDNEEYASKLLGSWMSLYGDQDLVVHLWVSHKGFQGANDALKFRLSDPYALQSHHAKGKWIRKRESQLLNEFAFFGEPTVRTNASHLYELRSYVVKPGTLIEWGNNWSKAVSIRTTERVGGFFSNIGPLYQVHYLWAYADLAARKHSREQMWDQPGWDDCVANTVPLVKSMNSMLLSATEGSPMR